LRRVGPVLPEISSYSDMSVKHLRARYTNCKGGCLVLRKGMAYASVVMAGGPAWAVLE
jgi:hypothetical protein